MEPQPAAAGSAYVAIVVRNASSAACTLIGYPGVSYRDASGQAVGEPADRDGTEYSPITLQPGQAASATLRVVSPDNLENCQPADVAQIAMIPPDQEEPLSIDVTADAALRVCTTTSSTTISAFVAG